MQPRTCWNLCRLLPLFVAAAVIAVTSVGAAQPAKPSSPESLLTTAERTDFQATSRYDDVVSFCKQLAERSTLVKLDELGRSVEGRSLPLVILADPPVSSAEQARSSGKLIAFAMGNIHAGEVCGKEALLMLARDIALSSDREMLKNLIILFAPIYNADGNERISPKNRPEQAGPAQGVGIRANAQGLDLNRDHVKLESPEARALAQFLTHWDPAVVIDCHTTNGSYHRYALTYDGPRHPATHPGIVRFLRDDLLPEIARRVERNAGYKTFFYGNFADGHSRWETYPALPRCNTHYVGLRQRLAILAESYSYAPFRDRVLATRGFVKECLLLCSERRQPILELLATARTSSSQVVEQAGAAGQVALRSEPASLGKFSILGYIEERRDGKTVVTREPRDYEAEYLGAERTTLSVARPYAYLIPSQHTAVRENLQRHGVAVHVLREDIELDVEIYRVQKATRSERMMQGHNSMQVEVERRQQPQRISAGTWVVRTDQPLGTLAAVLLEPQSQDGLTTWNFFDSASNPGGDFPVLRVPQRVPLLVASLRPVGAAPRTKKPITFDVAMGGRPPSLSGTPAMGIRWLPDGEHFTLSKEGRSYRVHAVTGRSTPLPDPAPVGKALEKIEGLTPKEASEMAAQLRFRADAAAAGAVFTHRGDLYYARLDGTAALRLTDGRPAPELATLSPNGMHVAYIRDYDLYVVDVSSGKTRRLTEGGSALLRNGKADWVYFEEVYDRNWQAYKWSPDSRSIAFQQFDDSRVASFAVVDYLEVQQRVETERFPLAGQPNPQVRLGVVPAAGGETHWVDTAKYSPDGMLITHFGWTPDSQTVFFYVQDRAQRWLDFNRVPAQGGAVKTLWREQSQTWVDNPGDPRFLKNGSFLLYNERDGWKHLYHYGQDGQLIRRVTEGPWEVRGIEAIDEANGWVYFTGTRDSHIAENLYRVKLDGSELRRLTTGDGSHRPVVNSTGSLFVDSWSDVRTPTRVRLCRGDGETVRVVDTNPVPDIEDYELCGVELIQIRMRDGFLLEGSLIKPPHLEPGKKYPVWLSTYGGPHAPSLVNSWQGGRLFEQMLAQMGIVAFRCDPRSASGKGANSTWTAYRQLGVQELRDLEDAIDWLNQQPYVDASRIGMSGYSYGGFLTAFALTHSNRFAAGIAGAPVTDWRNYDTIYTERYMSTPQENPDGYEKTSVVAAAKNLHGRLLLIHGARDDNVHLANTLQLAHALQQANKDFELMIYPPYRHGVGGAHYNRLMFDFIRRTMLER